MIDRISDETLIQSVADGDKAAMKALYGRYAHALNQFVKSRLNDPVEAADIVHDTLLDVWRTAARFEGRSTVKSWMFSIARNKTIDRIRVSAKSPIASPNLEIPDESVDAVDLIAAAQNANILRECLSTLSEPHR
ncbi:MAG: sigma-70 family RNA polymerase sigma factor, partial [Pseudomonadota bacterium]